MTGQIDVLPFLGYTLGVVVIVGLMFGLAYVLGERHSGRYTGAPFESGMKITGSARVRFSVKFYLVTMLFVLFDLEAVFIVAWAVSVREVGWPGYWYLLGFVGLLVVGFLYEWRVGALDWRDERFYGMHPEGRQDDSQAE